MNTEPFDIENATHEELLIEWRKCEILWGKYSCDCFGYYINQLHQKIVSLGGWHSKQSKE